MKKENGRNYVVGYLGRHCYLPEVPSELLQSMDILDMILLSEKQIDTIICQVSESPSEYRKENSVVTFGHVIEYYHCDNIQIILAESLPALQLRSPSRRGLRKIIGTLDLPLSHRLLNVSRDESM